MKKTGIIAAILVAIVCFAYVNINAEALNYSVGDQITDFKLKNTEGKDVSLGSIANAKGYIVIFTSNHCPFAKAYEDRILALDKKFAPQGFPVVAINSNDPGSYEEDTFENMKAKVKDKGYTFNYLEDHTQTTAKAFGAQRTPHVFLVVKRGDKLILDYVGAIDDNSQDPASVTKRYVEDAIASIQAGKPVATTSTKAIGCAIKWKE